MKMKQAISILLGVIVSYFYAAAQEQRVYEMHDSAPEIILFLKDLPVLIDSTNQLGFTEVISAQAKARFTINSLYQNKDFDERSTYWVQIPMAQSNTKLIWVMEFFDQTIDDLIVYKPDQDGGFTAIALGDSQPFRNRENLHKNFTVRIDGTPGTTQTYYARIRSHEFADIRIAIRSYPRFIYYALNEYFLFGTLYGMVIIIALYNFLVYLAVREGKYLFYIFYILSVALYAMSYDGIGFQYLWPNAPQLNDYAAGITLFSLIFWALLFTRRFLDTVNTAPLLDRLLVAAIIIRSALFLVFLLFKPTLFSLRTLDIVPLSIIFYAAIYVWRHGFKPARFFVIAYGILFVGFFVRLLVYFNVIPLTTTSHYSLHFSFVLEMLFLTFALGDRIRILKANQDRALQETIEQHEINLHLKEQVNRELEAKVLERTRALESKSHQLEISNEKLIKQSNEINQINSMLDLDNWKLKNRVKEVLNEMLLEQTMTYEEFKTLYPDMMSCYRFLENYKWEKGFICHKCGNEKYFDGVKKFSRRCTRCGHNESITANTIFHGLKFPVEKAFYLAYLTVAGKQSETLAVLSNKLELPLNTVWSYRSKVNAIVKDIESKGRKVTASRWEIVIGETPQSHT
jgi:two-component system, sensor histidine kinase LadS